MGGDTYNTTSTPPPVDYSAAMAYASDNNKTIAMGQIMAQGFATQLASMDRQMQTAANLEMGLERLDTRLQIAKLNYLQYMTEEENRHEEKMTEITGDIDAARAEQAAANTVDVSDFLGDGSYTPGAIWQETSEYANSNRGNFNDQLNGLIEGDQQNQQSRTDMMNNHEREQTQRNDDAYNTTSPFGDADGDGIQNRHDY